MGLAGWGPENPLLHFTALVVFGITCLTLLTMIYVLMFSARARRAQRRRLLFDKKWRPRMALASVEDSTLRERAPRSSRERLWWLMLWNRMQRHLRGQSRERLNDMLRRFGMQHHASRLLRGLSVRRRLVALESLRHLGDETGWAAVAPLCRNRNRYIALAAAHALLAMSPRRGLAFVLDIGLSRDDWSARHLADLCQSAGVEAATPVLIEALDVASPASHETLAGLLEFADPRALQAWARQVLEQGSDRALLHSAINVLGELADPRDHARITSFLRHGDWMLRLASLRALRRQGGRSDAAHYLVSLIDRVFAIRLEAADAISVIPGISEAEFSGFLAQIEDPYGRDQLMRALSARGKSSSTGNAP